MIAKAGDPGSYRARFLLRTVPVFLLISTHKKRKSFPLTIGYKVVTVTIINKSYKIATFLQALLYFAQTVQTDFVHFIYFLMYIAENFYLVLSLNENFSVIRGYCLPAGKNIGEGLDSDSIDLSTCQPTEKLLADAGPLLYSKNTLRRGSV